ncbi:YitT family protein [Salicibibacter halophilus]|uniref:YitT family protein n=1 Tax=Salicibibacter halophilus TaxID=2502791 RepID=A0A514LLW0_9BACI|nr:YitT family protein [Salicibibacter halophilus]QDI92515.1 YitT family protein [Salicibibacter halophilus]
MKHIALIVIGTLSIALATTLLAMPNQIADGGIVGLSLILYYAFGISPGIVTFLIFVALIGVSVKYLPRHMVYKTLTNVPLLSLFIYLTENLGQPIGDPIVAAIFAGLFIGIGFGLIIQAGSSIGGTSIIALIFNQRFGWDVVLMTFILDGLIVLAGVFVIGPLYTMYTVIALFIGKVASDYVLSGFDAKKAVNIVSLKSLEIQKKITEEMGSSATVFKGYGVYTEEDRKVVYVVLRSQRILYLKRLIMEMDPEAFVVVHNVKDVFGGTFFATPAIEHTIALSSETNDDEGVYQEDPNE